MSDRRCGSSTDATCSSYAPNPTASTAATPIDSTVGVHGMTVASSPSSVPVASPPSASPPANQPHRRRPSRGPPPEARSAQALLRPHVDPESATPATAAPAYRPAPSEPSPSRANVSTDRRASGTTGDVSTRPAGRRTASVGMPQTDQEQIVLVAPRLVKR